MDRVHGRLGRRRGRARDSAAGARKRRRGGVACARKGERLVERVEQLAERTLGRAQRRRGLRHVARCTRARIRRAAPRRRVRRARVAARVSLGGGAAHERWQRRGRTLGMRARVRVQRHRDAEERGVKLGRGAAKDVDGLSAPAVRVSAYVRTRGGDGRWEWRSAQSPEHAARRALRRPVATQSVVRAARRHHGAPRRQVREGGTARRPCWRRRRNSHMAERHASGLIESAARPFRPALRLRGLAFRPGDEDVHDVDSWTSSSV